MSDKLVSIIPGTGTRVIIDMSADTQIHENARSIREKALHDEAFYMEGARVEGERIGIEKERAATIAKLKARGMSDSEIEELFSE